MDAQWVKVEEARNPLFAGRSRLWISVNIFEKFPEIHKENNPSGWVIGAFGRGNSTRIYLPLAVDWLKDNYKRIEWGK